MATETNIETTEIMVGLVAIGTYARSAPACSKYASRLRVRVVSQFYMKYEKKRLFVGNSSPILAGFIVRRTAATMRPVEHLPAG
jgi:hypothetical protein